MIPVSTEARVLMTSTASAAGARMVSKEPDAKHVSYLTDTNSGNL